MSSGRHEITPLYHKIVAVNAVKTESQLSSMDRAGGINFHPKKSSGYYPNADSDMVIRESQLNKAVVYRLVLFENNFSGLAFGIRMWKQARGW